MTRAQNRTDVTDRILASARVQLAEIGPAALSLRAVARDIGMVSSAVYRYVASRDELLTALIVQCYDELGAAAEQGDSLHDRDDVRGRWMSVCGAIRTWANAHPHEYALLYGSPVPGYVAPDNTIAPATRTTMVLVEIVVDAHRGDEAARETGGVVYEGAREFIRNDYRVRTGDDVDFIDDALVMRTLSAWTTIFGTISFERFGHLVGSVTDYAAFYDDVVADLAERLGV
ncbi:TetR family transcriptional regulator [Rhodococcoides trifolii]|uniref:TetR family transcriptional regulator n=1 Tax=Rhodococcoides trifolii TaxID=908250 RepID=A0A917LGH8_9NOCA|nr:TetR/AcrR family transcriptional regulator [Rhodococcus trifolii]GGG22348.1 TetR family transcriptional regulator [Rhodococcus trifolii]